MRVQSVRVLAAGAALGAAAGSLVALLGDWWVLDHAPTEFGYYSYEPLPNVANGSMVASTGWWLVLWPALLVGAVVGLAVASVTALRRGAVLPVVAGLALGLLVGGARLLTSGSGTADGLPRRYVDYLPTSSGPAYDSTLTITLDRDPSARWEFLAVCAGGGLLVGFVLAGVVTVARRRVMRRSAGGAA